jgi:hypothetical protein
MDEAEPTQIEDDLLEMNQSENLVEDQRNVYICNVATY